MKIKSLLLVITTLLIMPKNYCQNDTYHKDLGLVVSSDILFNTISLITEGAIYLYPLTIEKYLNKNNSLGFTYILQTYKPDSYSYYFLEYKYYASSKRANQGLYFHPFIVYNKDYNTKSYFISQSEEASKEMTEHWLGYGAAVGYGFLFYNRLSVCMHVGMGREILIKRVNPDDYGYSWEDYKLIPKTAINIGYKF